MEINLESFSRRSSRISKRRLAISRSSSAARTPDETVHAVSAIERAAAFEAARAWAVRSPRLLAVSIGQSREKPYTHGETPAPGLSPNSGLKLSVGFGRVLAVVIAAPAVAAFALATATSG